MSKRVFTAIGLLAFAQAITVIWLGSRLDVPPAPEVSGMVPFAGLAGRAAFARGTFHLLGTLLAVPWLFSLPALAPLGKLPRLLFVPWGISTVAWIVWLVQGLPARDLWTFRTCAYPGLLAGTILPVVAIIAFRNESQRLAEVRPAARRGTALAAVVLVWCWAFAIAEVEVVTGALDVVQALNP